MLTDKEKLERIKDIIEGNLFSVFTGYALNLDFCFEKENALEEYVELKELLNINSGILSKEEAIRYDKFKKEERTKYDEIMGKLTKRMFTLRESGIMFDKYSVAYSLFMHAYYPIFINPLSVEMSDKEYKRALNEIDEYRFISG